MGILLHVRANFESFVAIDFSREMSFGRFITGSVKASFGELRYTLDFLDLSSSKKELTERNPCLV